MRTCARLSCIQALRNRACIYAADSIMTSSFYPQRAGCSTTDATISDPCCGSMLGSACVQSHAPPAIHLPANVNC